MYRGQQLKELQSNTSNKEVEADRVHGYVETDPTGRYARFDEVLGKGAIKTVYRAIDEVLGMEVAWNQVKLNHMLKSPEELERLYSEVHLLSTLNHDSIIRFYTSWVDVEHKSFNFITEMFTSGTLRQYRTKYRRIDIRAIKSWARQILRGLVYLHGHDPPVIHRDLKCDNIFVNGHLAQVKIGDLGLAAILRGSQSVHSVIGTPEFMAPELYEEDYNELVDVYAFGMCVLEMLTSEFPYSECANPAQIYKKVTSGKLPGAYHQIHNEEARNFVGKCLQTVSKRPSAKQLLADSFLSSDEAKMSLLAELGQQKPLLNDLGLDKLPMNRNIARTKMSITGKLNAEDDAIFLKVQIADKKGAARNIFFPFDIVSDTPLDVAMEMVKELEIDDWEPFEIADMIDGEISALVPNWRKWDQPTSEYQAEYDIGGHSHPLHSHSSSPSQSSASTLIPFLDGSDWLQDDMFDETSSQSSSMSGKYSNFNYFSGNEHEYSEEPVAEPQRAVVGRAQSFSRFGQSSSSNSGQCLAREVYKQSNKILASNGASDTIREKYAIDSRILERNNSLFDVRSQLLHQSLLEEAHKRRLSRTVGAVEHIGFQAPYDVSRSPGVTSRKSTKEEKVSRNGRLVNGFVKS